MANTTTVPLDELLAHRAWVRSLARSLVVDAATADDVEQEVWLRTLRSRPQSLAAARSWLSRVLRNVVRDRARGESRRRSREDAVRRAPLTESAYDIVARTEAHRDLVSTVLALPEPYRRVILMRYFDGLPAREIARLTGAPTETVRKQVQRGLAALRRQLGAGSRQDWRAALAPILGAPLSPPPVSTIGSTIAGGAAVGTKGKLAVTLFILVLLGLVGGLGALVLSPVDTAELEDAGAAETANEAEADDPVRESVEATTAGREDSRSTGRRHADAPTTAGTGEREPVPESHSRSIDAFRKAPVGHGEVAGLIVGPDGIPLAGATVFVRRIGSTEVEPDGLAATGPDGTFRITGLEAVPHSMAVAHAPYVSTRRRVVPGAPVVDVRLEEGFEISGTVVLAESGDPLASATLVLYAPGAEVAPAATTRSDGEGRFAFTTIPNGEYSVHVGRQYLLKGEVPEYEPLRADGVAAGTTDLVLRVRRGAAISGRLIDELGEPVTRPVQVRLTAKTEHGNTDFSRSRLVRIESGDGAFRLPGLADGMYDLTFAPAPPEEGEEAPEWAGATTVEGVAAGTDDLEVRLGRAATIAGRLVDEDGQPLEAPTGWLQAVPAGATTGGPGSVWIQFADDGTFESPPLDANRSYDIVAGGVPGHHMGTTPSVAPGARDVLVRLARATRLAGVVMKEDGRPVAAGVPVIAMAQNVSLDGTPGTTSYAYTRSDGSFSIERLGEFTYQVAAGGGQSRFVAVGPVRDVAAGTSDLELRVQAGKSITGKLVDASGKGIRTPMLKAVRPGLVLFAAYARVESDDGSFAIHALHEGQYRLYALVGERSIDLGTIEVPASDVVLTPPAE